MIDVSLTNIASEENKENWVLLFFLKFIIANNINKVESISGVFLVITIGINGKNKINPPMFKYFFPKWYIKITDIIFISNKLNIDRIGILNEIIQAINEYNTLEYL